MKIKAIIRVWECKRAGNTYRVADITNTHNGKTSVHLVTGGESNTAGVLREFGFTYGQYVQCVTTVKPKDWHCYNYNAKSFIEDHNAEYKKVLTALGFRNLKPIKKKG